MHGNYFVRKSFGQGRCYQVHSVEFHLQVYRLVVHQYFVASPHQQLRPHDHDQDHLENHHEHHHPRGFHEPHEVLPEVESPHELALL